MSTKKYQPIYLSSPGTVKESILVSELLLHTGGLIPDNSLKDYEDGPEIAWQKICNLDMTAARGERFMYTDVGFIVLAKVVERLSGKDLNQFTRENIFKPLGMRDTGFCPRRNFEGEPRRRKNVADNGCGEKSMTRERFDWVVSLDMLDYFQQQLTSQFLAKSCCTGVQNSPTSSIKKPLL